MQRGSKIEQKEIEMSEDRELKVMGVVLGALEPLDVDERKRVLSWLTQKFSVAVPVGSSSVPKSSVTTPGEKSKSFH